VSLIVIVTCAVENEASQNVWVFRKADLPMLNNFGH
jgi:hypothetical protein